MFSPSNLHGGAAWCHYHADVDWLGVQSNQCMDIVDLRSNLSSFLGELLLREQALEQWPSIPQGNVSSIMKDFADFFNQQIQPLVLDLHGHSLSPLLLPETNTTCNGGPSWC